MKKKALRGIIEVIYCCGALWLCAGCGTFRWGERTGDDWQEISEDKQYESHFWPDTKPKRSMQDPRWTP